MSANVRAKNFPAMIRFRTETGLFDAVADAARRSRTSPGEYLRRAVRERVVADGIPLPPLDVAAPDQERRVPRYASAPTSPAITRP